MCFLVMLIYSSIHEHLLNVCYGPVTGLNAGRDPVLYLNIEQGRFLESYDSRLQFSRSIPREYQRIRGPSNEHNTLPVSGSVCHLSLTQHSHFIQWLQTNEHFGGWAVLF